MNGGDVENATTSDYVMHFLTFGFKVKRHIFVAVKFRVNCHIIYCDIFISLVGNLMCRHTFVVYLV